jgi:hypothetical protein
VSARKPKRLPMRRGYALAHLMAVLAAIAVLVGGYAQQRLSAMHAARVEYWRQGAVALALGAVEVGVAALRAGTEPPALPDAELDGARGTTTITVGQGADGVPLVTACGEVRPHRTDRAPAPLRHCVETDAEGGRWSEGQPR